MRPTSNSRWAHVCCALHLSETTFNNMRTRDMVLSVGKEGNPGPFENLPVDHFTGVGCTYCRKRKGEWVGVGASGSRSQSVSQCCALLCCAVWRPEHPLIVYDVRGMAGWVATCAHALCTVAFHPLCALLKGLPAGRVRDSTQKG
jgi:hypothetical protein